MTEGEWGRRGDGGKGSTGREVEELDDSVKWVGSCPFSSEKPRGFSFEIPGRRESREKCDCCSSCEGAVRRKGSLFISALCFRLIPRPSRWIASFSFAHHPLPEKWSLPPSLDTVRSSEEENLGL